MMKDSRQSPLVVLLYAVVVAGLAVSGFFLPVAPDDGAITFPWLPWFSNVLALLALLAVAVSVNYVNSNSFQFITDSRLLYLPYMLVSLAFPGTIVFSYYHLAAFFTVWTVYYTLMYVNSDIHRLYYAFMAGLTSSVSAILVPPMLYVGVFVLIYIVYRRGQDVIRLLMSYIPAFVLSWLYIAVWKYIFPSGHSFGEFLTDYGMELLPSFPSFSGMTVQSTVYVLFLAAVGLRSLLYVAVKGHKRNKAQKNAFGLSVALSVLMLVIELCFSGVLTPESVIVAGVPFSFCAFNFVTNSRKGETSILLYTLLLLTVLLRVADFLTI